MIQGPQDQQRAALDVEKALIVDTNVQSEMQCAIPVRRKDTLAHCALLNN